MTRWLDNNLLLAVIKLERSSRRGAALRSLYFELMRRYLGSGCSLQLVPAVRSGEDSVCTRCLQESQGKGLVASDSPDSALVTLLLGTGPG